MAKNRALALANPGRLSNTTHRFSIYLTFISYITCTRKGRRCICRSSRSVYEPLRVRFKNYSPLPKFWNACVFFGGGSMECSRVAARALFECANKMRFGASDWLEGTT